MFLKRYVCILVVIAMLISPVYAFNPPSAGSTDINGLIQLAGNSKDEQDCLKYLKQLRGTSGLGEQLKKDIDRFTAELEQWINADILRSYEGKFDKKNMDYDFGVSENSAIYPIVCFYRAKMICWAMIETGIKNPADRRKVFNKVRGYLEKAKTAFPENRIIGMYLGEVITSEKNYTAPANAPQWAIYQRENLERLTDIAEWWVDNRQQPEGDFRGGWGDDCEMWRSAWLPLLLGFENNKLISAQMKFSESLMKQPHMSLGYTSVMQDVEHTSEDSADAITPMIHLFPEEAAWKQRALKLADLMENLWMGKNERGFLQFKSIYFTSSKVDESANVSCDTVYHSKTVQPLLLYWQRTGEAQLTKLFTAWMDTWVDATAKQEKGKPAGLLPSAIHWPAGAIGGTGENWWDPAAKDPKYGMLYVWPSFIEGMEGTLLLTYHMTKDEKYLEPIRSMADIYRRFKKEGKAAGPVRPGNFAWYGKESASVQGVLAKYKVLTGSKEFDDLLMGTKLPYLSLLFNHNYDNLTTDLKRSSDYLKVNFPFYTSEVRYTDRVISYSSLFQDNSMYDKALSHAGAPNINLIYSSVTGDPGSVGYFPMNAVQWGTNTRDIAALVTETGSSAFSAELFHFGKAERPMSAKLYLLKAGQYDMTLRNSKGTVLLQQKVSLDKSENKVSFILPAYELCTLQLRQSGAVGQSTPQDTLDPKTPAAKGVSSGEAEFNGITLSVNSAPVAATTLLLNNTVYASINELAAILGKNLKWNIEDTDALVEDKAVESGKGTKQPKANSQKKKFIEVQNKQIKLEYGKRQVLLEGISYNDKTYIPVKAFAELLGKNTVLDTSSKIMNIIP